MASSFEQSVFDADRREPEWIAALSRRPARFVSDRRFTEESTGSLPPALDDGPELATEENLWQRGYDAGMAAAEVEQARLARIDADAHDKLRLAFARLDACACDALAEQLADTVVALCEATLAPLTLDRGALQQRCEQAARGLGAAPEHLTLRLCPQDAAMIDPDFAAAWRIVPDAGLNRGALCLESRDGGIADDPALWTSQLRQALRGC